jgi:NitT/TauT family transport system ATP-binding protein
MADQHVPGGALGDRIIVRDLVKEYVFGNQKMVAVDRVSFTVPHGQFVALLGPSGCGKSTILNMVAGLLNRSSGEVLVDGKRVVAQKNVDDTGYVFQRDTVFPWRTVEANVGYGLEIAGVPRDERRERVHEAIRRAHLSGFEKAYPLKLSGGMRQRVALMRTLIMRPGVLLMDEPFGALDAHTKLELHNLLLEIWEQERQTVLFVTHDLGEALTLADRVILLSARPGRIKEDMLIPFERPRDAVALRETKEYAEAFSHFWRSLGEEFERKKQ